jgi:hypothetical protein
MKDSNVEDMIDELGLIEGKKTDLANIDLTLFCLTARRRRARAERKLDPGAPRSDPVGAQASILNITQPEAPLVSVSANAQMLAPTLEVTVLSQL